jgi:DNA-binding NarL/FixJ family response regulator
MNQRDGYHWRKRTWPSPAQRRVLDALKEGGTNAQIAGQLGLSFETVKWHISELLWQTDLGSRTRLSQWWK